MSKHEHEKSHAEQDHSAFEAKIAELEAAVAAEKESKLMGLADLDNYRKRMEKERHDLITLSNLSILRAIADVIDDFERMVQDLEQPGKEDRIDAFKPVLDKTKGILRDYGIEEIVVNVGDKFDPKLMEGLGTTAVEDEKLQDTVVHVAQKGYRYANKDMMVRHARVIVGKINK